MKVSEYGHLLHLYYGRCILDGDVSYLIPQVLRAHESDPAEADGSLYSQGTLPQEFSSADAGDDRAPSIEIASSDGSYAFVGKYRLDGLPSLFEADGDEAETLEIDLADEIPHACVTLCYGVFPKKDIITRTVRLQNEAKQAIRRR